MGSQDYGIIISQPGVSVANATGAQVLLDSARPFIKIDTQNKAGFQTITLLIVTDPPEPSGGATDKYTTLYQFKHGYSYIPSLETLFYLQTPPPGTAGYQLYSQDSIFLGGHTIADGVYVYAIADKTYVYIICDKQNFGGGSANLLTGTNLQITTHVFTEDIGAP